MTEPITGRTPHPSEQACPRGIRDGRRQNQDRPLRTGFVKQLGTCPDKERTNPRTPVRCENQRRITYICVDCKEGFGLRKMRIEGHYPKEWAHRVERQRAPLVEKEGQRHQECAPRTMIGRRRHREKGRRTPCHISLRGRREEQESVGRRRLLRTRIW